MKKIMISAGEASGDIYGAELAREFRKIYKDDVLLAGFGGRLMKDAGVDIRLELTRFAVVGFAQAAVKMPGIVSAFNEAKKQISSFKPDILVVIDYPGFHLKLIETAKKLGAKKVVYYITPQVWAWKYGRIKKIKKYADLAIPVLPFEKEIFEKEGINCGYFGHPLASFMKKQQAGNREADPENIKIGIFPGSRRSEVEAFLPVMLDAAALVKKNKPESSFFIFRSEEVGPEVFEMLIKKSSIPDAAVITGPAYGERQTMNAVMAKSGTTTLELALAGVPQVIAYKVSAVSYGIIKLFAKISGLKYIGLPNLILDRPLVKELIQADFTAENMSRGILRLLDDEDAVKNMKEGYKLMEKMLYYDDEISGRIADAAVKA
ncbi:MAG TPA: lipid-A-disaccharide synthase [Firmicutes bacterium]|nr:lipid-A-disaccharide synthase [Bacillota bacterium]